ncbi:MAG: 2-phosphosulfolactate phosphatase [Planctomycetes bacterium]|nr:2-phosphosulfolactate phosphatase [Planctomycetota bacterium]MCB9824778.1 2-phosphosulfolactate phosphatase [Planctomycetota bacterium]MCB9899811.1 2-phosphosulfolactate phosphatase [Planctomycetota bacterium]
MHPTPLDEHAQDAFDIRLGWGPWGLQHVARDADVVVIVDVLSFTTCVEVAASRGIDVIPFPWRDDRAAARAKEVGAVLATRRGEGSGPSLSPASLSSLPPGSRLLLPSPNGSELSTKSPAPTTLAGCLRNAKAVAQAAAARGRKLTVIASGEKWPDGSLRPALEDHLGAGAILRHLSGSASPEAQAAVALFEGIGDRLPTFLSSCASGRELITRGYARDVELASALDVSTVVPVLRGGMWKRLVRPPAPGALPHLG